MSSGWSDLLDRAVERGALRRWRRTRDGKHVLAEAEGGIATEFLIADAEAGVEPFLIGLRAGMRAMLPIDVEVDYRPTLRHHGRVVVPAWKRTPRTVVDLQTAAWCVDPTSDLTVQESDEGDVHAEMT